MQERANQPKQKTEYNFDVTKHIRLVPPFQEKEVDKYFLHFEKVAENLNWPKEPKLDLTSAKCFDRHSVRGPLKLLKEKFLTNDETPLNLLQYVSDFRNRLSRACEVARSNLRTSPSKMKARYDNHVIDRKFEPGDKVLALLPIPGRPLQAR